MDTDEILERQRNDGYIADWGGEAKGGCFCSSFVFIGKPTPGGMCEWG